MIYQHPLGYLIAMEGLALLRAWAGDEAYDESYVRARIAETRRLLAEPALAGHPGVAVERDATDAAYVEWAPSYDDPGNGLFELDEAVIGPILADLPAGDALDAACGTGRLAALLAERGHRLTGVDRSRAMLDRARSRLPDAVFHEGTLDHLPVPDGSADVITCGLALVHVADLGPVFAEFARVLRPGGHLIVSDLHPDLTRLGSAVVVRTGRPRVAATHRHTATAHLRAALAAGLTPRGCEERPDPTGPTGPAPEPSTEIGAWTDWPWSLLGWAPEAARAAWHGPAVIVWDFVRERDSG